MLKIPSIGEAKSVIKSQPDKGDFLKTTLFIDLISDMLSLY